MKSLLKTAVMHAYCRGWISGMTVLRIYGRFDLWNSDGQ